MRVFIFYVCIHLPMVMVPSCCAFTKSTCMLYIVASLEFNIPPPSSGNAWSFSVTKKKKKKSCLLIPTCHTSQSSIIKMSSAEVNVTNSCAAAPWTVNNSCLSSSAEQIIQKDGAKTLSKVGIRVVGIS